MKAPRLVLPVYTSGGDDDDFCYIFLALCLIIGSLLFIYDIFTVCNLDIG